MTGKVQLLGTFALGVAFGKYIFEKRLNAKYDRLAQLEIDDVKKVLYSYDVPIDAPKIHEESVEPSEVVEFDEQPEFRSYRGLPIRDDETLEVPDEEETSEDPPQGEKKEEPMLQREDDEDAPHFISLDEFQNGHPEFDKETLTYYEGDDTIADEQDVMIDNVRLLLGEDPFKFGYLSEDPSIVYIRNGSFSTDYELIKDSRGYAEMIGETPGKMPLFMSGAE